MSMGYYKAIVICALLATSLLSAQAQVSSENYVQTSNRISDSQMQTVTQYYDGLGRPTEKVEHGVTPDGTNLVHLQEYDGLGRDLRSWLPVKTSSSFLGASDVSSLSQWQYHDSRAYSAFVYDGSPLDRVVQEEGVGEDWKNHPVQTDYLINTTSFPLDCKYYRVSMQGELQDKGYYPEGRLKITKTTDEDGHASYEFKNLSDRVVLRRAMLSKKESADTYYIYDYRGNLSFVLPPNYQEEASLDKYAYQYKYDGRGNCIWKKLPGCEPTYMRYTRNNRLAFLQDGNLRKQGDWEFYVYDKLGRMVVSGITSSVGDVSETYVYAQYTGTGSLDGYISAMSWQVGDGVKKGFFFDYDNQNMLAGAEYGEGSGLYESNGNYDEYLSYDKMGNVLTLMRYGLRDNGQYGLIDNLGYGYNGNQLLKVDDAVSGPYYAGAFHFVDGANESVEYTYDANGNMVSDKNKGISSIAYDINNRPLEICFSDGRKSSCSYDAEGNKHSVSYSLTAMTSAQPLIPEMQSANAVSANATNGQKTITYCDNIIYDDGETIVLNDIGYAKYDKSGNLSFHYYLQDHLGNNRVVMSEDGTIEQVNDYYPTGALMGSSQSGEFQRYKYNGKELDRTHGLDWYDYGARNYDAALVRWNGVDELSEKYYPFSSWSYCFNNFVNNMDKDGKRVLFAKGTSEAFKQYFKQAITYLKSHKADGLFAKLQASNVTIYIGEQKERYKGSRFFKASKVLLWDPLTCLITTNNKVMSATTVLNHEADHALQEIENPVQKSNDEKTKLEQYGDAEEKRVITGSEQRTARALGEIREGEVTRSDHAAFPYMTNSPTSVDYYGFQISK